MKLLRAIIYAAIIYVVFSVIVLGLVRDWSVLTDSISIMFLTIVSILFGFLVFTTDD